MKILQLNLNHCQAAQDLLKQSVRELSVDVAMLSEPYQRMEPPKWLCDASNTSAIWSVSSLTLQDAATTSHGYIRAKVSGIYLYSCYIPPRYSIEDFGVIIDNIVCDAGTRNPVLIAGDFNAWAIEWGCPRTNERGRVLLEAFSALDVVLMNSGNEHTFSRGEGGSVIDIAFASNCIANCTTWRISDLYTHSDHCAIIMDIAHEQHQTINVRTSKLLGWKVNTFDKDVFKASIEDMTLNGTPEVMAKQLIGEISRACDVSMVKRKHNVNKQPVYWWNTEIAELRSECVHARRKYTRSRGRPDNDVHHEEFKAKRKSLKLAIRRSKRKCFVDICDEVENNPWGLAYQLVTKKLKCLNPAAPREELVLKEVVEHLFPQQEATSWNLNSNSEVFYYPPVTNTEIEAAVTKFKDRKAPGLDCIPNHVLKEAVKCCPDQFTTLINACLRNGTFPSVWKKQKLVLLPKNKKPLDDPSSYRPLCMIDTCGKLLESIICKRLESSVEAVGGLSDSQFGFRKARSTVDAINVVVETAAKAIEGKRWQDGAKQYCVVVTLDVKNAFNTANWGVIIDTLTRLSVPEYLLAAIKDYFRNRILIYDTDKGTKQYNVSGGVPQGSVLGPLLWNIMYDAVLRLRLPDNVKIVGFADDIALVCVAKQLSTAETITNASVQIVRSWLSSVGLKLADHKTEAVLISSRKKMEKIRLNIGSCHIDTKPSLKYLGVMIDCRLSFSEHLKYVGEKSSRICTALSRIMPNIRGPRYLQRKLLTGVVKSVILYASSIWSEALRFRSYRDQITPVYRLAALRVCSAFRTVSDEAAFVIAGMIPIDIQAMESGSIGAVTSGNVDPRDVARSVSVVKWQARWSASGKGRWTHSLIPDVSVWFERGHGDLNFYLTQMLSGHGCFRSYLYKYGHDSSPFCPSCIDNVEENAEHVFFVCPRFEGEREHLVEMIGHSIRPGNIVQIMLTSLVNWTYVCEFVRLVLVELRRLERIRNRTAAV